MGDRGQAPVTLQIEQLLRIALNVKKELALRLNNCLNKSYETDYIGGDPLSNFQDNIGMKAPGSTYCVPIGLTDPFSSHSINNFLNPHFYY
jgi:hypothetical protein